MGVIPNRAKPVLYIFFQKPPPSRACIQELGYHSGSGYIKQSISWESMPSDGL